MSGGTKRERQIMQVHLCVPQYIAHHSKHICSLNLYTPLPTWILCVTQRLGPGTPLQACQNACQLTL